MNYREQFTVVMQASQNYFFLVDAPPTKRYSNMQTYPRDMTYWICMKDGMEILPAW